jgi:hypothetical protein
VDSKLQKWLRWFGVIEKDIQQLLIQQHIFWKVQDIIRDNKDIQRPSAFYDYLGQTYIAYIAIGIRRQVKSDRDSISFSRLLKEIMATPSVLSREFYKSPYCKVLHLADGDFDQFVGENRNHVAPEMVSNDWGTLRSVAEKIEAFADKRIAHRDVKPPRNLPTFNEVDECLDTLDRLAVKYIQLFRGDAQSSLMPTFQYDWMEIFRVPWLPPYNGGGDG